MGKLIIIIAFFVCVSFCLTYGEEKSSNLNPEVIQLKELNPANDLAEKELKTKRNISIVGNEFMLDGVPFRIMSGSVHYFRLPHQYWRDRLKKVKAAGLNAVSTYVEWSSHEPEEGIQSFEEDSDIVTFIKIAEEEGLHVLLRPGPYICAERDLGGIPYWLLGKYPHIQLRSTNTDFINETKRWFAKLFALVKPFLYGNGGPVILVQVENEYGSYGADKKYMEQVRDIILEHVGTDALLYTTDGFGRSYIIDGMVSGTLTTVDFGPISSDVTKRFRDLRSIMPSGPLMNSEYYPGWLTHWTENLQQVSTRRVVATLRDMIKNNINFNFYMFFGGTNFGLTAGANYGSFYQPDITSYDYDAPLSEAGDPTDKYYAIRDAIAQYYPHVNNISSPVVTKKGAYGEVTLGALASLMSKEGREDLGIKYKSIIGAKLPTFEELRQFSGNILYETTINEDGNVLLEIKEPRDWIFVYVNNKLQGVINRMHKMYSLVITSKPGSNLSLLVENQGRINFGPKLHDYKGILSPVILNNKTLEGPWSITGYPLNPNNYPDNIGLLAPHNPKYPIKLTSPMLFANSFVLPAGEPPLDTFIDMSGWGKGYVTINRHVLGRYWPQAGPQVTLYVPGVWLKPAPEQNIIVVVEMHQAPASSAVKFIDYPIINRTSVLDYSIYSNNHD